MLCRVAIAALWVVLAGCAGGEAPDDPAAAAVPPVRFTDATAEAGIAFVHHSGADGRKLLPETMGPGCAWFDYDRDGDVDLFLVNGRDWEGRGSAVPALYRNTGDGRFEERTVEAGLDVSIYGMGAAVGDVNNDGYPDLFVSAVGRDRLFANRGDGTFAEVTGAAGLGDTGFGAGAVFADFDRDGNLDLFVTRYVPWTVSSDQFCSLDGVRKAYCTPQTYPPTTNLLYRNRGDGRFEEVGEEAGIAIPGKSLGVVVFDHDADGWPDIAVSNDTVRNFLFRNLGDGTFEEIGRRVGFAFSESGRPRAGMGIDAGDYDGSGRESLVVGNFSAERVGLFRNSGLDVYRDVAAEAGVGTPSLWTLAFGTVFLDFDLDGRLDLFVANGHVEPDVQSVQTQVAYAQPPHLFHNRGDGGFVEVTDTVGGDLATPLVARGVAHADYDRDGDLDLLVTVNGGAPRLYRNDGGPRRSLQVRLIGSDSNRDGYGATVIARIGARRLVRVVRSGGSYLSHSEPLATFGLGETATVDALEVRWPSGRTQSVTPPAGGGLIVVSEGDGRVSGP